MVTSCAPASRRTSEESRPWSSEFVSSAAIPTRKKKTSTPRRRSLRRAGWGGGADAADAAITALEASEDRGLKHYLDDVCKLDRDTRTLVAREILPEQVRTYDSLTDLKLTRRL